ncbi:hypothetical protein CBW24_01975 [Pacificitalea manganoxidans]|uniref:Uncharacterized protein n=1 Tax=Pacificitalea manganoxidans TaxID=1411902 RepID=A0A291LW15_9RHOB|nr:hypothetical protein [Pacificitalea manganoxidans]ATI40891.1 hypothetical protein CBW24_01975 [Pacificitalea manganoxidans]MDR6308224.1 hypothetical protein [Pacificitalea manganoxidans]
MPIRAAQVQYNDYRGTVAADRADDRSLKDFLEDLGLARPDEIVVGCRISFYENPGQNISGGVVVYLQTGAFGDPDVAIRAIEVNLPFDKLFSFFKRFDLVFTTDGRTYENVEVDGPHYG